MNSSDTNVDTISIPSCSIIQTKNDNNILDNTANIQKNPDISNEKNSQKIIFIEKNLLEKFSENIFEKKKKKKSKTNFIGNIFQENFQENSDPTPPPPTPQKEKAKRVITQTEKWKNMTIHDLEPREQFILIKEIHENKMYEDSSPSPAGTLAKLPEKHHKMILQQIQQKIYGYKIQDMQKNLFSEDEFVDIQTIIEKMIECNNQCFYCKTMVHVLYEYVREPKQWTVERIDNKFGHNKNNISIACLNCNLHRRTMYHERYLFTKQLVIQKI
jgi:hypothetical protein